jgi:hypothetical protein
LTGSAGGFSFGRRAVAWLRGSGPGFGRHGRRGSVLVAIVQQTPVLEQTSSDDTFRDLVDVAGVAVPLAAAVLIAAVSWPNVKRWFRHRTRRHRRRKRRPIASG